MRSGIDQCPDCGADRPSWMGGHHQCMVPEHPYEYFTWLIGADEDE